MPLARLGGLLQVAVLLITLPVLCQRPQMLGSASHTPTHINTLNQAVAWSSFPVVLSNVFVNYPTMDIVNYISLPFLPDGNQEGAEE